VLWKESRRTQNKKKNPPTTPLDLLFPFLAFRKKIEPKQEKKTPTTPLDLLNKELNPKQEHHQLHWKGPIENGS